MACVLLADTTRIKAAIVVSGGLARTPSLPEVEQVNFAPHVSIPILMLNGRYDFEYPIDTSQVPLFRALGTAPEHKRHVVFETGHAVITIQPMVKESLDWLDTYLGPVKPPS